MLLLPYPDLLAFQYLRNEILERPFTVFIICSHICIHLHSNVQTYIIYNIFKAVPNVHVPNVRTVPNVHVLLVPEVPHITNKLFTRL